MYRIISYCLVFSLWFVFNTNCLFAQTSQFTDSIAQSLKEKVYFTADWGSRNSFIANRRAQMTGYSIGVDFGKNLTIGGGINLLSSPLMEYGIIEINDIKITAPKKWNINYMAYYLEYTFYHTKHWKFSIPVQAGWGITYRSYYLNEKLTREDRKMMFIYEPTMSGTYKFHRYFGIGADVGYRIVFNKNKAIGRLTSPVYVFSFKVFYSRMYNDLKTKFDLKLP